MNKDNLGCISGFNFHHKILNRNPYVLHRICYYEGQVQNTKGTCDMKSAPPPLFSSPGPKVHVNYCHHLASVVRRL